ncbi:MAG: hypothetical protein WCK11_02590 [Candidatus Falkowbacteria bacterium]
MPIANPEYIPKSKGKSSLKKSKQQKSKSSFPAPSKQASSQTKKPAAPFGKNHVWAN